MNYLITGAARGIGRHLSLTLVSRGHRVVLLDLPGPELNHTLSLLDKIASSNANSTSPSKPLPTQSSSSPTPSPAARQKKKFLALECDLRYRAQIRAAVRAAERFLDGRLDVLINNAMVLPHTWPHDYGMEDGIIVSGDGGDEILKHWDAQIAVGLSAPFLLSRLCVKMLRREGWEAGKDANGNLEGGFWKERDAGLAGLEETVNKRPGCIVNISSTRATQAEDDHEGYSSAKAGLLGLSQSLAVSLGKRYGIRVNTVLPGWINVMDESKEADEKSTKWEDGLTEEDHAWHLNGRVGKGEDVMKAVDYLVESGFVTGEELRVSGGVERRMIYPE